MTMFGIPYYQEKIDPNSFNKNEIIETIKRNYEIDPLRNAWDSKNSKLHHFHSDVKNPGFRQIDIFQLMPIYYDHVKRFFDKNNFFNSDVNVNIEFANYTCMTTNNYMQKHLHNVHFVGVHYIKFNKHKHSAIKFYNPNSNLINFKSFSKEYMSVLDKTNSNNFYVLSEVSPEIEEDDFIITPGIFEHSIPEFNETDELRMTLVINIKIK